MRVKKKSNIQSVYTRHSIHFDSIQHALSGKIFPVFLGGGGGFFIRRVKIPSPKIVKNLTLIYKKLYCKGKPYRFLG